MGNRRLKLNDEQRWRLAAKAKKLGRKTLGQVATIAAPETLLRWHGKLIAQNDAASACPTRAGLQLIRKSLVWLSAWLKRIDTGAIGGYREHWPTWATIWHTIRFAIFSKSMGSSHLRSARGRRPGESSFKDIGSRLSPTTSSRWLRRRDPVWPRWSFSAL